MPVGPLIRAGESAPDFAIPASNGKPARRLSEVLRSRAVVIFFYPKDATSRCTAEATSFRDRGPELARLGAEVVGVSRDPEVTHAAWSRRHQIDMPLVPDPRGAIGAAYGVSRAFGLLPSRVTVVVDRGGLVSHVWRSLFQPRRHVEEAIAALARHFDARALAPAE